MNYKELEETAKEIAKAVNDGELEKATGILRVLSGNTKLEVMEIIPSTIKTVVTVGPHDTL